MAAQVVVRVIVNPGHGLGNDHPNVYDSGASSPFGTEAYIVSRVAEQVTSHYYRAADDSCTASESLTVIPTPECSIACASSHKGRGHLAYLIEWINANAIQDKDGYHDVVLSLHMNESPKQSTSGALVVIDDGTAARHPERFEEAKEIARIVANALGIPSLGVMLDSETPRRSIGIVQNTHPPAYLIELGFVSNPDDVRAVETCGKDAVMAVIDYLAGRK